jgi:serine/threonine-protein kinase
MPRTDSHGLSTSATAPSRPGTLPRTAVLRSSRPGRVAPFQSRPRVDEDLAGQRVGRFTLHEIIAPGRSGPLYKAYDPVRGSLIGLKLVTDQGPDVRRRLLRAGRLWLDLRHPNLATVFEVQPDYHEYVGVIASELVEGEPLSALRDHPQLALEQTVAIGAQLCDALGYMHDRGIIHREVRPHNVLVTVPGCRVKLLDSGIARHANPEIDAFTRTGMLVGDLTYASPELAMGRANQRADLYAVGPFCTSS